MRNCKICGKELIDENNKDKLCPLCKKVKAERLKKGFMIGAIILFSVGALYAVSPIDILPDGIPGLGWIDDVLIGAGSTLGAVGSGILAIVNGQKANQ